MRALSGPPPRDPYDASQYVPVAPVRMQAWIWERAPYIGRRNDIRRMPAPSFAFGPSQVGLSAPGIPRHGTASGGDPASAPHPMQSYVYPVSQVGQLRAATAREAIGQDATPAMDFLRPMLGGY